MFRGSAATDGDDEGAGGGGDGDDGEDEAAEGRRDAGVDAERWVAAEAARMRTTRRQRKWKGTFPLEWRRATRPVSRRYHGGLFGCEISSPSPNPRDVLRGDWDRGEFSASC